jgi:protein-S-isoprenylcysteine O-methyltransferase Ste14
MNKKSINFFGNILVFIQFAGLIFIAISCSFIAKKSFFLMLEIFGFFIAIWSIWIMRKSKISAHPQLRPGAILITELPYSVIRHPMYLSVLLVSIALVLDKGGMLNFIVFAILLINLLIKIEFEERILKNNFAEYTILCRKTKKLIPWIY